MKIAFLDISPRAYHAGTPLEEPMGGIESATCHLGAALAESGHEVSLLNHVATPCRNHHSTTIMNFSSAPLLLCVSAFLAAIGSTDSLATPPNVILIITDDQGYGDVSAHGNPVLKTPNLDTFRESAVRFTDFHVAPMCSPTRGQLMTGIDAMRNGCTAVCEGRSMMRSELPTMADFFTESGYATGHFGKWHLGDSYPHRPGDRGFQETIHHRAWGITSLADHWENHTDPYFDPILSHNGIDKPFQGYCTDIFFDEAMRWIERRQDAEKPFFVYLPTNTPHVPDIAPEKYLAPYAGEFEGRKIPTHFYGMIANLDENLGRLESFLEGRGLKENTIVIYLSDNGTQSTPAKEIFNAGMREKKTSVYEGGHRVPLFIRWPGGELVHGEDIGELTQVQDLLPTLIELCDLESIDSPLAFDGTSLAGLLRGETTALPDRKLVVQYRSSGAPWDPAVVMWNEWRLLKPKQGRRPRDPGVPLELYHVGRDPGQETNVASEHPDVVAAMRSHYEAWHAEARALFDRPRWIIIGSEAANPVILYSQDWVGDYCDNPGGLRRATAQGYWNVIVARPGVYEIELRRWPRESGKSLAEGWDGPGDRGPSARPIEAGNLRIAGENYTLDANEGAESVSFRIPLEAGKTQLQTAFLDGEDRTLCSAIYTYVKRLEELQAETTPPTDRRSKGNAPLPVGPGRASASVKPARLEASDILIADFEREDWGDWTVRGTAFGSGPTRERRVATHEGNQVVYTFVLGGGDAATGKLTSPVFSIERPRIQFLIGGGNHREKTCVNLLIDGEVAFTAVGPAAKNAAGKKVMRAVSWDVSAHLGKEARIEIVDEAAGGWGHIVVDQVFQTNRKPAP